MAQSEGRTRDLDLQIHAVCATMFATQVQEMNAQLLAHSAQCKQVCDDMVQLVCKTLDAFEVHVSSMLAPRLRLEVDSGSIAFVLLDSSSNDSIHGLCEVALANVCNSHGSSELVMLESSSVDVVYKLSEVCSISDVTHAGHPNSSAGCDVAPGCVHGSMEIDWSHLRVTSYEAASHHGIGFGFETNCAIQHCVVEIFGAGVTVATQIAWLEISLPASEHLYLVSQR